MTSSPIRQPSALVPLAMSLAALTIVLVHAAIFGVVQEADEGTAAHVFQLLMVGQVPIVVFFAAKWLPRAPQRTLQVLVLQVGTALAAVVSVVMFTQ